MSRRYPPEVAASIESLYEEYSNKDIARILNERFPDMEPFTAVKVNSWKKRHGLKSSVRILPKGRSKFPEGLLEFVTENISGRSSDEMAAMVRERFGISFTVKQARAYIRNHGLASGYDTRFKKGHASFNKGLKQTEFMSPEQIENSKRTRFQTGHMPHNHLEVGTVVVTTDGYLARKIGEPSQWEMVHRRVWEDHNGPIPKGYCIIFLDGNPLNCDISNLQMVSLAENCRMNQSHMRFSDPELTKIGIMVAKLSNAAGKKKRSLKK